jgi:2-phospho-L-lactate guanylyltransferase
MGDANRWSVVVPTKDTRCAKSRLGGAPGERRQLAIVMARDTLSAIVNAASVEGVMVVCQRAEDVESFALPGVTVTVGPKLGLNDAARLGASLARADDWRRNVAVLPADLPYLRSGELDRALAQALHHPAACVADRNGDGTTLLTAREGSVLAPAYGDGSLREHRDAGAVELEVPSWSGLRRDVDVRGDLFLGPSLGRRTRAVLDGRPLASRQDRVSA